MQMHSDKYNCIQYGDYQKRTQLGCSSHKNHRAFDKWSLICLWQVPWMEEQTLALLPCSTLTVAMWVNSGFDDKAAHTSHPLL